MSVIIKNMEMPKSCIDCDLQNTEYDECMVTMEDTNNLMRPEHCPLIDVTMYHITMSHEITMKDLDRLERLIDRYSKRMEKL